MMGLSTGLMIFDFSALNLFWNRWWWVVAREIRFLSLSDSFSFLIFFTDHDDFCIIHMNGTGTSTVDA